MTRPNNKIVIPYTPRRAFMAYHDNTKRFGVTVAHRRAGKTVARINRLIKAAVLSTRPNSRFGYLAPYYVQAKDIAWAYLKYYCAPLIELGAKVSEAELSIVLPNGSMIRLYGADNAERMRGLYFDGIVVDEAQAINQQVLTTIILPALADRQGWLDVSGTPRGWENLLGKLVKIARENPDQWFLQILKASQSGILPTDELQRQRDLLSDNEYDQEFECSFDAAITGAVYGAQIAAADAAGRITAVEPLDKPVNTAWDLGFDDSTAIWFWQLAGASEIRIVDYFEDSGQPIDHYCDVLATRGYKYDKHFVPHDAANKLLAAGGRSIVQQAYQLGVKMTVIPATSQQNGIEAARKTLDLCWFDEKNCASGIDALRNYQYEFDKDRRVFRSKPRHDWSSHAADAFEIIGQAWRNPIIAAQKPKPKFLHEATADDLFWGDLKQNTRKINRI
ncbi:MAG: hypothetical protein INF44_02435 [Thalassospira sp.]|nr:hypothetical protein [Thalassospira sp.]